MDQTNECRKKFCACKNSPECSILFELMTDFDEGLQEWRYRHVKLVERTIGAKKGTGGSPGVPFLKESLFRPVFHDLWAIRHETCDRGANSCRGMTKHECRVEPMNYSRRNSRTVPENSCAFSLSAKLHGFDQSARMRFA